MVKGNLRLGIGSSTMFSRHWHREFWTGDVPPRRVWNILSIDHLYLVAYRSELTLLKRTRSGARPRSSLMAFAIAKNPQSSPLYWRDGARHSKVHSPMDKPRVTSRSRANCRRAELANALRGPYGIESMKVTCPDTRSIENIVQWPGKCRTDTTLVVPARASMSKGAKAVDGSLRTSLEV